MILGSSGRRFLSIRTDEKLWGTNSERIALTEKSCEKLEVRLATTVWIQYVPSDTHFATTDTDFSSIYELSNTLVKLLVAGAAGSSSDFVDFCSAHQLATMAANLVIWMLWCLKPKAFLWLKEEKGSILPIS